MVFFRVKPQQKIALKLLCLLIFVLMLNCNNIPEKPEGFYIKYEEVPEKDCAGLKTICGPTYFEPLGTGLLKAELKNNSYDTIFIPLSIRYCDSILVLNYDQYKNYKFIDKDSIEEHAFATLFLNKPDKYLIVLKNKTVHFFIFPFKNVHLE